MASRWGEPADAIRFAVNRIDAVPACRVTALSTIHVTDPVGFGDQPRFSNAAAAVITTLPPREFLDALLAIERDMGRDRASSRRWGPRVIDLDLLLYGDRIIDDPGLTVPHPRMLDRRFVLEPLCEIAPDVSIPGTSLTIRRALESLALGERSQ